MIEKYIRISPEARLDALSNEIVLTTNGGAKRLRIEPIMARLITVLAKNANNVVSRELLVEAVWDGNEGVGNKALTKNIYKLRKLFENEGLKNPIETLPKKGYRLSLKQPKLIKKPFYKNNWVVAAAVVIAFIVLKMAVPGLFHMMNHGLSH